jgi:hypothetical protein
VTYGKTRAASDIDASVNNLRREILRHAGDTPARKAALDGLDTVHRAAIAAVAA